MTFDHLIRYQAESVARAKLPWIAKHSQNQQIKQPERAAA
nr:MAG TPA_asm: hypothetical protein [Caudoviricetes sp.]